VRCESDPSSQASGASTSASNAPGCAPPGRSRSTPTGEPSSPATGPTLFDAAMYATAEPTTSRPSTSSAAASPAKTSALPVEEPESVEPARVYGPSSLGLLASYDPATSSWRTFQLSLDAGSASSLAIWPRSGMTRSGTAYQRVPLVPLTAATGSGWLPTPTATVYGSSQNGINRTRPSAGTPSLHTMALHDLWPTPVRNDARRSTSGPPRGRPDDDGRPDGGQWAAEPDVGRVADGVPRRVDRLAALGDALVPQLAEWLGRAILAWEADRER
jgi:hypothetical protein